MEKGIRDQYFHDITKDYIGNREASFLFQYFQRECERKLAETIGEIAGGTRTWEECLLKDPNENMGSRRRRSDLWEELCLNDEGLRRNMISAADYCAWIISYLESHPIYYKDTSFYSAEGWQSLKCLLSAGSGKAAEEFDIEGTLKELTELIRRERGGEPAGVLQRLGEAAGCLADLAEQLRKMAIHIKIKNYLQDSGYPLRNTKSKKAPKVRNSDGAMHIFETYCDSEKGYEFVPKNVYSGNVSIDRHYDIASRFFYLTDKEDSDGQIARLAEILNEEGDRDELFIPLASDAISGSVFFLAGKGNYEELYQGTKDHKAKQEYEDSSYTCCFDFLCLNDLELQNNPHKIGAAFQMLPRFHENAGKTYTDVLEDFKWYCTKSVKNQTPARESVMNFNGDRPEGIPNVFWDFFAEPEEDFAEGPSIKARERFEAIRRRAEEQMRSYPRGLSY